MNYHYIVLSENEFDCIMDAFEQRKKILSPIRDMARFVFCMDCLQKLLRQFSFFDAENRKVLMQLMDWEYELVMDTAKMCFPPAYVQRYYFEECISDPDHQKWSMSA